MTRDEIIQLAIDAGLYSGNPRTPGTEAVIVKRLQRFAALVAAAEREECAKVCEQRKIITPEWQQDQHYNQGASHCAAAIRARGGKGQS